MANTDDSPITHPLIPHSLTTHSLATHSLTRHSLPSPRPKTSLALLTRAVLGKRVRSLKVLAEKRILHHEGGGLPVDSVQRVPGSSRQQFILNERGKTAAIIPSNIKRMGSENLDVLKVLDFEGIAADVPGVNLVPSLPATVRRSRDPLKLRPVRVADPDNGAFPVVAVSPGDRGISLVLREVPTVHHSKLFSMPGTTGIGLSRAARAAAGLAARRFQTTAPVSLLVDGGECPAAFNRKQ